MLNWTASNRIILTLKLYLHWTELFEIELFWHYLYVNKNYTYTKLNYLIGLGSLFNGISTFVGYLMPKLFS